MIFIKCQLIIKVMWLISSFIVLLFTIGSGAPIKHETKPATSMPTFIKEKFVALSESCYKQSNSQACRMIYVVPARSCQVSDASAKNQVTCLFLMEGINAKQVFVAWTKKSEFSTILNIESSQNERIVPFHSDPIFDVFGVSQVNSSVDNIMLEGEKYLATNFTLQSHSDKADLSQIENLPIVFFFSQIHLDYLDLKYVDPLSLASSLTRRGVEIEGSRQPPCKRSSLQVPIKWLLNESQRARVLYTYPEEADIGTCSALATSRGFDTCQLRSKDWSRAYDMFRIGLLHEYKSNPFNNVIKEKHKLLGQPSCSPAAVSDLQYVQAEFQAVARLYRYRVITISNFIVTKCACF